MSTERFTLFYSSKSPFSQHHLVNFTVKTDEGEYTYNSAEQFMMAAKACLFQDDETWLKIMNEGRPQYQKKLGRLVKGYDDAKWDSIAKEVVYTGNYYKFTQNPELKLILLATEGTTLVESSPVDQKWGIGLSASDPRALDRTRWLGTNWLGEILTTLREDLIRD